MAKCLDVCFHNAEPKWQQSRARGLGANVNIIPITLQPRTSWVLCLKQYGGTLHIVTAMRSYQNCGKNSINISGRGTSADQKLNNLWRKHQQAPGSCLIINWCVPSKKFTENLQEHEFMLGLRCRGRGRELFITVVYEIFLGGNIYMFGAEARPAGGRRY